MADDTNRAAATVADRPRRRPIALVVSDEATFETYPSNNGGVMLVMRPHGVERGDDREVGWDLTPGEVVGIRDLLTETHVMYRLRVARSRITRLEEQLRTAYQHLRAHSPACNALPENGPKGPDSAE